MELTILITTIDEAENLKLLVPRLQSVFQKTKEPFEILIVDGGSKDGTEDVAKSLGCRVIRQSGPGYSQAIRDGIRAAQGKYLIVMDGDLSHLPEDALKLFEKRKTADIVINSRYVKGGGSESTFWRQLLSWTLNQGYRIFLGLPFKEVSGGFRIYDTKIFKRFELSSSFYEIQEELLVVPYWMGFQAIEIPYVYREREKGQSKAKILKYGYHLVLALLRFRQLKKQIVASA